MSTPSIQTLITQAQQVLNLKSTNEIRATLAAVLANANVGTPLNPSLTTQQLWDEFYEIVRQPSDDIMSIVVDQMMRMVFSPPAPGGAGADKQVIFNDGGVLAGDAGLTYNKATDALTITGDLTVDTSTLKVDSTNNRVGIGTASPATLCEMRTSGATDALRVYMNGGGTANIIAAKSFLSPFGEVDRFTVAGNGVCTWSNVGDVYGTSMTLNSTGLGIGVSPSYKIHAQTTSDGIFSLLARTGGTNNPQLRISLTDSTTTTTLDANSVGGSPILALAVNGTTRMTLDSSGNVGVGVTPSAWGSSYKSVQTTLGAALAGNTGNLILAQNCYHDGTNWVNNRASTYSSRYDMNVAGNGFHAWYVYNASFGTVGNTIPFTQAMTLDASGNLMVGQATVTGANADSFVYSKSGSYATVSHVSGTSSGTAYLQFLYNNAQIGTITQNGTTGVLYNIVSDYRLKESVKPINGGLARVNALKPSVYNWKSDGSTGEGFLAHELAEVVPFAVSGEKDAVNADGSIKSQGIDMSRVVPILVAAIQELTARVQTLEAR